MPTTCDIELQNYGSNIVYAGQELCGTVRLTLTEERHLRGIYIQIYGKGFCQWVEGRTTYTGRNNYLDEKIYFLGAENGNVRVEPNTYTYNFRVLLPAQLPGSIEGSVGHIRYNVRVVLASFSIFPDKKFKQLFRVVRQLNLNDYPTLRRTIVANASYKCQLSDFLCFCRLFTVPPKIFATIPMSGYVPLQTINIEIHVENRSVESYCEFEIKLIKQIQYFSDQLKFGCWKPIQRNRKEKQKIVKKAVNALIGSSSEIINVDLQVPPTSPTDFLTNNIITVTYYISISGTTGLCNQMPIVKLPITIGTYPIQIVEPNTGALVSSALPPEQFVSSAPPDQSVFGNSDDSEPPSYAEATAK